MGIARLLLAALLAAFCLAACSEPTAAPEPKRHLDPALANLRALFVGIDQYRYSDAREPLADFSDLAGAVGDTQRFKSALEELYGLALDKPEQGACESRNAVSITLTNACATRAAILAALDTEVARAEPGETLLFYFAGHGSRYSDDTAFDQDSGYNGTILPADARNPNDPQGPGGDIFDTELRALKDRATEAGVRFVTIFDSCNSATATRDGAAGVSRSAPPIGRVPPPAPALVVRREARTRGATPAGYWVHLAAAQDGEEAQEAASGAVGKREGVFTNALIETLRMPGMRHATFGDIIREVRLRVAEHGHVSQTPSAEGQLTAALGRNSGAALLFDVASEDGAAVLAAGSLSGVTPGSRFALYASQADAVAQGPPLAEATIDKVAETSARLAIAGTRPDLPQRMVAVEVAHFFPPDLLDVGIDIPAGPVRAAVETVLRGLEFVSSGDAGSIRLARSARDPARIELRAGDGTLLADLGPAEAPGFADDLGNELQKVARVRALLALRTTGTEPAAGPSVGANAGGPRFAITTCVAGDGYRASSCPALETGGVRRIGRGIRFTATVINRGSAPAHLYLLAIDPLNAVTLVVPRRGELDQKVAVGQPYRRAGVWTDLPGLYRFIAIATETPIRADAFEQSGNGTRGFGACASPLERLLCSANDGLRNAGVAAVGDWSAEVSTVLVTG